MKKLKFYLRADRRDGGCAPLYIQISNELGRRANVATGLRIPVDAWNAKTQELLPGCNVSAPVAGRLVILKTLAAQYMAALQVNKEAFNPSSFAAYVLGRDVAPKAPENTFVAVFHAFEHTRKVGAKRQYLYAQLLRLVCAFAPGLLIEEINFDFLNRIYRYFLDKEKNSYNTANNKMKIIKAVLIYAENIGLKVDKSIGFFKLTHTEAKRAFLSLDDLDKLEKVVLLEAHHQQVRNTFLFSCYTGLRYSDIAAIAKLKDYAVHGTQIIFSQQKTKQLTSVPLSAKALQKIQQGALTYIYSNQKCNKHLKNIMKLAGIRKSISFHCGRHSFATCSLTLGIPIAVLQQLMGHTKISTTMQYAKVVDTVKIEAMKVWDLPAVTGRRIA